ncbi:MAG: hypothetical protein GKR87_14695 [Kiritimatiellae bacterium]|nr:hypothetical protein [Kiritimatiellia bacterium]
MKKYPRNIYKLTDGYDLASTVFLLWCEKAEAAGIHYLKQMALRPSVSDSKVLLAYSKHSKLTSEPQEGLNNKIGWLTRQAYGDRNDKYLYLKIYDLPNLFVRRSL